VTTAANLYRAQAAGCRNGASASPFYAAVLERLALDADRGGPAARVLDDVVALGYAAAVPLRLLGGLHRGVLAGELPTLAVHYPSPDSDGDADAAAAVILEVLAAPPDSVRASLRWDPQTNEVGRAAALAVGLGVITQITARPLRLLEIGASGGLNLRLDRYRFERAGVGFGDPAAAVRFGDESYDGALPFADPVVIAERRGCDLNPIDASSPGGALTLTSYVWPDQRERLDRLRAALGIAADLPVPIDRARADDWVAERVAPQQGVTTVMMHSIMWQYVPAAAQRRITAIVHARARVATDDAPLAWLRFEPRPDQLYPETRVRIWPHAPADRLVAASGYHGPPVRVVVV
jgi:hypothetical protein